VRDPQSSTFQKKTIVYFTSPYFFLPTETVTVDSVYLDSPGDPDSDAESLDEVFF
jgi:hypothetical protein